MLRSLTFTIVTPGSLDHGMHFGLEVKWLSDFIFLNVFEYRFV